MDRPALVVPFTQLAGIELLPALPGAGRARIDGRPAQTNHLGSVHAGALFTLGEVASAHAVLGLLGEHAARWTAVTQRADIRYQAPARGAIEAQATVGDSLAAVLAALHAQGRTTLAVTVALGDAGGRVVAEMALQWFVGRPRGGDRGRRGGEGEPA